MWQKIAEEIKTCRPLPIVSYTVKMCIRDRLKALDALAEQTQCTIVGQAAVLAEGDAAERKDISFLEPLPLFFH